MKEPNIVIAAATCRNCNNLVTLNDFLQVKCNKCGKAVIVSRGRRRKLAIPKPLTEYQKYHLARGYGEAFHKSNVEESVERLGTFATTLSFKQYKDNRIARHPDGSPNFELEGKIVRWLRRQTYKKYDSQYTMTEGDIIRGIAKCPM